MSGNARIDAGLHQEPAPRIFRGDKRVAAVAADDRGLAYGDGVFETMRGCRGTLPWWPRHWARLQRGADRLQLVLPTQTHAREQAEDLLDGADGVVKLLLTRGSGGRGYVPPREPVPTWILSRHALPPPVQAARRVRWCETRLSVQPALAGIKHCNRLEQILARAEWKAVAGLDSDEAVEGLMRSTDGDVVCATAANLFLLDRGRWRTPLLDRCGVAGTMREWVLEQFGIDQQRIGVGDVEAADALVLTNAVRGILQVVQLGDRTWQAHPSVADLRRRLSAAHPAFFVPPNGTDPLELP